MKTRYLILGAGPAGLTVSNRLKEKGVTDFIVLEKEKIAGGLCRSIDVDGAPLDIGGGHFLDVRRPLVNKFLFKFMPENEWTKYNRNSTIVVGDNVIDYPIEANIWQMKIDDQVEYLKSIAIAGCNIGKEMPTKFVDWIYWKLGNKIAEDYMIPYNQKMFNKYLNLLGTYWLEKLPNVSFEETLLSCINKKPYGKQPGHTQFFYPKDYGYGELWRRMAENIKGNIKYGAIVNGIDFNDKTVILANGEKYEAEMIITTIPWMEFKIIHGMPNNIIQSIRELKYSSIQVEYHPNNINTNSHWIYYPDMSLPYHRILVRHNFCQGSNGYWTETNSERLESETNSGRFKYMNKYAYPLNTLNKRDIMKKLLDWSNEKGVFGIGRWGEHQHYNSDVTVELAMKLAEKL